MGLFEKIKNFLNLKSQKPKTMTDFESFNDMLGVEGNKYFEWKQYLDQQLQRNAEDKIKYADYDLMDNEIPEVSAALDVMADFIVYPDNVERGVTFKVKSSSLAIQEKIEEIDKVTNFPREFHSIARDTCKYGDDYEELIPNELNNMILFVKNIPIESVIVNIKDGLRDKDNYISQIDSSGKIIATLSDRESLHFSLKTNRKRYYLYGKGTSRIEKARLLYRQLRLMEEGVIIKRLSTSNNNYGILVDVGSLEGDDVFNFLEQYRRKLTRRRYIDPKTGRLSLKFNPLSVVEDILVPTRQGSGGNIIPLNQNQSMRGSIDDINYFQNKLIYALDVPKVLLGKEEDVNSKSTSDVQMITFLRNIRAIQICLESEIKKFYYNALLIQGYKLEEIGELKIVWPIFGTIDEERKWRIELLKTQVASALSQDMALVDDVFIYTKILGMTEEEYQEIVDRMDETEEEISRAVDAMNFGKETNDETIFQTPEEEETENQNKKLTKEEVLAICKDNMKDKEFKILKTILDNAEMRKTIQQISELTNLLVYK